MSRPAYLIGIDVGGTFTDLLAYDASSARLLSAKVPSLPGAQWQGVLAALDSLGIASDAIRAFVHGTTIATNALLERKGARTALVTTRGFRDVLEIGKGRRLTGGLFDARWRRPQPLVPRDLRFEIDERTAADGEILRAASAEALQALASALRDCGAEAIAVALLNSYVNGENERSIAAALRQSLADAPVSESASLVPERGEFERTSTCVLNACLTPVMQAYLRTLSEALSAARVSAPINIMGSNGGAMSLAVAAERCAATFLSGPVGGVVGALRIARAADLDDFITFDMGGTSTDVALVHQCTPRMSHDNQVDAYPLQMPQLDIHTIGAGGGSIIWLGEDGTLQIGPRSAGAVPGPACYGRGGSEATVSDANLMLGRLTAERPLAGGLRLDREAAERVFAKLGERLATTDLTALADAALKIAVARMAGAVREVSVHRGFDPRDFVLCAFGGAGPMHGFLVAEELGMTRVLVPRYPGHLSALGQMLADQRHDFVLAWGGRLSELRLADLHERARTLTERGRAALLSEGLEIARHRHAVSVDMRYAGQSFTLAIAWDPAHEDLADLRAAFDGRHEQTFGYADRDNDAEIVNLRVVSVGEVDKPELRFASETGAEPRVHERVVWFDEWRATPVYDRALMPAGFVLQGPAIIEEAGGTSVVPPGWRVRVHPSGSLACDRVG